MRASRENWLVSIESVARSARPSSSRSISSASDDRPDHDDRRLDLVAVCVPEAFVHRDGSIPPSMTRAVFLDALGTLVELEPPWIGLRRVVPESIDDERLAAAVRAEMGYYREHAHEGRDPESLAGLRDRCAELISTELGEPVSAQQLVDSVRFYPFSDAEPALQGAARARPEARGRLQLGHLAGERARELRARSDCSTPRSPRPRRARRSPIRRSSDARSSWPDASPARSSTSATRARRTATERPPRASARC